MDSLRGLLRRLLGKMLCNVQASYHVLDGKKSSDTPIAIWLRFSTDTLGLRCASDGETLAVEESPPEQVDMGEFGQISLEDRTREHPWKKCEGRNLDGASLLIADNRHIGIKLVFNQFAVVIVNWGDDLVIGDKLSPAILQECVIGEVIVGNE